MHLVFDLFLDAPQGFDPSKEWGTDRSGFRNLQRMTAAQRSAWDTGYAAKNAAFRAETR